MASGLFMTDIILAFGVSAGLLYRYGNWQHHNVLVTLAVLISWYFSLLIIFILPLDVSTTVFRQCLNDNIHDNGTNGTSLLPKEWKECKEPWNYVPEDVLPNLWKVVYWTSQFLTWLILPLMQSYARAGEFTFQGKLKSALVDNAIYYGSYLFICGILLIYIATKPGLHLDGPKLKVIASSASNTWGLFLLVLLLGYALVEIPRNLWLSSSCQYTLHKAYFKAAKLSADKCEAEDTLDDTLESVQSLSRHVGPRDVLYPHVSTILHKVPLEMRQSMQRRQRNLEEHRDTPSLKALVRLHKQLIKALQTYRRCTNQWELLVDQIILQEDVAHNQLSRDHRFKPSFPKPAVGVIRAVFNPTVEWYWRCVIQGYLLQTAAVISAILSAAVVWSEVTFFNKDPVLSIFARLLKSATIYYDYLTIELLSTVTIAYLCFCAYSTILRIRVLNYYYLAPHHQTDENSLIFSGMMVCRLTPPLCLNFLGLIHMDSHIIKNNSMETYYTQVMGHMDVVSIISDGFNVYFPMGVLAFCLATYLSVGSRLLSLLGFPQFLDDDDLTSDLVDEGKELISREKRRRQRFEETTSRRKNYQSQSFQVAGFAPTQQREDSRSNLLAAAEPVDSYQSNGEDPFNQVYTPSRIGDPPRDLFDDI